MKEHSRLSLFFKLCIVSHKLFCSGLFKSNFKHTVVAHFFDRKNNARTENLAHDRIADRIGNRLNGRLLLCGGRTVLVAADSFESFSNLAGIAGFPVSF